MIVSADLSKGSEHVQLRNDNTDSLEQWVVCRCDFQDLLNQLVLLGLVVVFKLVVLADQLFKLGAREGHYPVLDRDNFVRVVTLSDASIALFLIDLKHEGVQVRLNEIDPLGSPKILLDMILELLHFISYELYLTIKLFELGTEFRVDDVVILLGFANIDALLEHGLQLGKFLKSAFQGI